MCEEEARVVQMRPVEKAVPGLSGPVGGSVSCVLGVDAVVLGGGGVLSGAVGRCVYVGDVAVSAGGDIWSCEVLPLCCRVLSVAVCVNLTARVSGDGDTVVSNVDTVVTGAISGVLCYLDRVSGGGDMDVSGVDTVMSGAVSVCLCDLDSVSITRCHSCACW